MKTKQTAYWLLSLLMLATATMLTACADDDDPKKDPDPVNPGEESVTLGEPIGLVYTDFLTENDVTHNADTTELTISKALADKKGITDFVNRPMGIWDKKEHRAYLRRATEQQLVGDHYVLKVVRSSVAEVTQGQELQINTGLYYNPTRRLSRGGLTRASGGDPEIDKYIDDDNIIHPAAITVQRKVDDGSNSMHSRLTRSDGDDGNSATFTIEELYTTPPSGANGWFDWLEDAWNAIVEATSYDWNDDNTISLIHTNTTLSSDIKFECGKESSDTITLRFRCPMKFDLDYTLKINSHGSIETAFVPIPSYLETYIEGYFEANPQLRIGFSKAVSIPEDKQRITLFQFSGVGFTFMLGPVPLTIDIDPSVYLKFTSTLSGDAYFGVQYDIASKFKFGVKYDSSGWSGIGDGEKVKDEFSFINPKLAFRYIGSAGIYFGVDIIIEKVAGPSLNIGPRVAVDAKLSYELGADHVDADIEAKAGIGGEAGAKIKIFGFNVLNWQNYFDIGPQWTIFKYPDDGSGSSGNYDPDNGGGGKADAGTGDLGSVTSDYVAKHGETLTGTLNSTSKVSIADGATVTLDNVTINGWYDNDKNPNRWAGLNCLGDATIILVGTNNVKGFNGRYPGIHVPEGKTLTIMGTGSLNASSNGYAAGIGGGQYLSCGNIVIKDGNINATGVHQVAGIGGGRSASCGSITISGGTVNATGGYYSTGIGGAYLGSCGDITITDGVTKVTATKGESAPYSIGAGFQGSCGTVSIGGRVTGAVSTSPFTYMPGTAGPTGTVDLSVLTSNVVAYNGDVITGTLSKDVKISVADGATVTLDGATVNVTSYNASPWAGITCLGNATLVLKGANTVKGFSKNYPGIHVAEGKTLTIRGDGSLIASSLDYGAGIGGGYEIGCGNIVIEGGTVNATGSAYASGIGSGYQAACGNITLKGGSITATGGSSSAAVGSAYRGSCGNINITSGVAKLTATAGSKSPNSIGAGASGTCGTVTIGGLQTGNITTSPYTYTGGTAVNGDLSTLSVDYEAKNGEVLTGTLGANVKISIADGATVTLDGVTINGTDNYKYPWAGINCTGNATIILKGSNSVSGFYRPYPGIHIASGKTLTIRGDGTLNATSIGFGAGIGSGYNASCGNIVIEGGTVNATGGQFAAGIGGGFSGSCGNITITNTVTKVTATKGSNASYSIGATGQGKCGTITIGGQVTGNISTSPYIFAPVAAVTGVSLSQTSASLKVGEKLTLTATVAPANATNKNVTWSSSNTAVATVDGGVVTAKAAGSATITVKTADGAKTATCTVTVTDIAVTGVTLSQTSASLKVGEKLTLTATVAPANATNKNVTWSSSNTAVATVDGGVVTAKAAGSATITVKTADGAKTATCTVTVLDPSAVDLNKLTSNFEAKNGDVLTGTLGANVKISIANGATVTLNDVNINGSGTWTGGNYAGINCEGNATIILKGSNTVKGFYKVYPGIHVPEGKTVTIKGDGSLTASSNGSAAGIGGGGAFGIGYLSCGNIVIEGGNITANAGRISAGIGGGYKASCGNITIKGGTVNAKGGEFASGIGSGREGSCGNITITNGVTSVTASKGDYAPHSIGSGYQGSCGTVTIGGKEGAISQSPYTYRP